MAEQDLDAVLRDSLARLAKPTADPAGVADAIRARVAAGDPGAAPSTAPGWGAALGGGAAFLPWVGLVVAGIIAGGALGASGLAGHPVQTQIVSAVASGVGGYPAADCPGGGTVTTLDAGQGVLAVERTQDTGFIAVRDPRDLASSVWLPAIDLVPSGDLATLPVGGCGTVAIAAPAPTHTAKPASTPTTPTTKPTKPTDKVKPTITSVTRNPGVIYNDGYVTVTVVAHDNVKVTGVKVSWSGGTNGTIHGSASMHHNADGTWTYQIHLSNGDFGQVKITVKAHDAAGNTSAPASPIPVKYEYFG